MAKDFADINRLEHEAGIQAPEASTKDELVKKFVKAWENQTARRVAKGGTGLTMALTLAACGSSSSTPVVSTSGETDTDTDTDTTPVAAFASATQEAAAGFLTKIAVSDAAVETATIAAGASDVVLAANDLDADEAATTAADATTDFDAAYALVFAELPGLETSSGALADYAAVLGTTGTLASLTVALGSTAVTAAARDDIADTIADLEDALAFEASADAAAVAGALVTANGAALVTDAEIAAGAGLAAVGTFIGDNAATVALSGDATAATAAEDTAGIAAYSAVIHDALLANSELYAAEFDALDADDQQLVLDAVEAAVLALAPTQDANSGVVTADADAGETLADAGAAALGAVAGITIDPTLQADAVFTYAAANAAQLAVVTAAVDQGYDAVIIAAYEDLIAAAQAVADEAQAGAIQDVLAGVVGTESLGEDNIDVDGGAATTGNDVFIFSEAGGATVVGTAATTAAPENVFGGVGEDSIVILGEYTFVTITEAQSDAIGTTSLGEATVTEIFVYQDATSGDAVLHVEDMPYDGNDITAGALTTLTITDTAFADLSSSIVDGFTILSPETAAVA